MLLSTVVQIICVKMQSEILVVFFLLLGVFSADRIKIHTQSSPYTKDFSFFPLRTDYLEFNVNTTKHVNILLSNQYGLVPPYYEIVLGANNNVNSFIRKNRSETTFLVEHKGSVIKRNEFQKFWISVNDTEESISAGMMNGRAILHYQDENYIKMSYFGIATAFGGIGEWDFDYNMLLPDKMA